MGKESYLNTIKMQWVVNEYRRDRRTGALQPVKASRYFKELSKEGAGLDERKAD